MDRRCAAGALVALAACIATTAAAPTASNQTALDLYDGASEGCYYNFQHYGEGDRIMTNEPCLNCTCHNRMLMCYLRVCPFTKPIGQDCSVEKRADQCCPIVTCPDVPVDLLTSTSTSSPSEYGETGLGKLDRYGCSINGKYFPEGSKVPPSPNKPCEHCYCIRNMTTCVMQECTLHVDGCTPIYRKDVCCPVRYSCDHPEDEIPLLDDMTTTVRPTPGFLLTTTTLSPVTQLTQDCVHDDKIFADGALIKTEKACEHCYCMKGDIVCVVQECGTPMENEGKNCTSMPPREGQCCPDTYICEGDEVTTETKPDIATVTSFEDITTLSPPRRVSVEGSGYRSETDEPYTEVPIFESDSEGSGEDQPPFKPTDTSDLLTPESETSTAFIGTVQDDIADKNILITTGLPESDKEMAEKVTTDAESDKETYEKATTEAGPYNQIIEKATTEAGADKEMAEKVTTDSELENEMAEKATTEAGSFNEIIEMATTEAAADKEISEKVTTDARPEKEIAEKATTEAGSYNEIVDTATTEAGADKEMAEKATTEADKGENTVPSGDLDEDTSEASLQDKTSPQIETTTSKLEAATESSGNAKTTVLLEDETSTEDKKTTPHEEITGTEPAPIAETTIADEVNTAPGSRITSEGEHAETTLPTRRKEDDRLTSNQITTLAHSEEATTKATDLIAPDTVATESTTASFIEQGTTSKVPEKDVDRQEPTTEENLELTTKFDIIKTETQSATTVQPEIATDLPTPGKVDFTDTTSANPIENEIDEESFPTLAPGRIPGEGDCLLDGITYSHESIVPSTSNCHTSCRCISSIVKCEPIICSPPPDYMDNCQPMYDSPESCCPTYVCDHPKETVPPQSHSQMAGTENPVPTPTIECDGDQCDVAKDKEGAKPPVSCTSEGCTDDSSKKPVETTDCGPQGCGVPTPTIECEGDQCEVIKHKEDAKPPLSCTSEGCTEDASKKQDDTTDCGPQGCGVPTPTIECDGDKCEVVKHKEDAKPPVSCTSEGCTEDASKKQDDSTDCGPQGCGVPTPTIECNGDQCEVVKDKGGKPPVSCTSEGCTDDSSKKQVDTTDCGPQGCGEVQTKPEEPRPSEPAEECTGDNCLSPPLHCAAGNCETPIPKDQTCNNENGCEVPVIQTCEGDNCAIQPDHTATKDDSTPCDNPESCKDGHIPDKPSDCEGESCVFVSPSQTIPQKDCKDGDNCVQQTPVTEECNEEDCKRQQVPKVDKPPSDCTGTECIQQQDIEPQITHVPEINTESAPKVTGLPEESDIKLKEPVTDLPKTTTVQTEDTVPSATTIGSISDSKEELETTPHYDVIEKEKEPEAIVPESPETVTPEGQKQESVTEGAIEKETTMGPLQDITTVKQVISEITPAVSESPSTETPSLPDKDTKEITTSVTEDTATDKDALDITTTEPSQPAVHSTSSDINQATTESQEMLTMAPESLDRDGHEETTKEPEYVQDTEPKVTERYTSAPEQVTDKLDVEPIEEQEPHGAPTTPKSYDIQTNVPGILETEAPSTSIPETQTTSPQEEDKKESELPVSTLTSEEPITDKPDKTIDTDVDVSSPDNKAETKSPVDDFEATTKSEIALDGSETQSPELSVTPVEQAITKAPVDETEIQTESYKPLITSPQETATEESDAAKKDTETPAPPAVNVPTQTPMSIVKDYGDDEISSTTTPQSEITSVHDELITKTPESPESGQSTETPSEKPVSEFEKMPSVSDVEHAAATTEKSGADLETTISSVKDNVIPSEQSVHDTDITAIPETEASTDSTPVSVPTIMETISSGPSVTEPSIQESSAPQEETSEAVPITSVPREDMETKLPVPVTESSVQPISVGVEIITPAQEHTNENTDATELPELVIHEHPTEPSSIIKETDQPATEDTTTNLPDMADKEQEITPEKDTSESSDAPTPQDDVTVAPQITTSESQKEMKVTSDQESVTKMPEFSVSEIDDLSHIPESSPTESQKEVTEGSQANTTNAPETTVTDAQKGATETPAIQTTISSVTKISETEPQETVTEVTEVQNTVTDADVLVTQPHKHTTDAPVSYDMITKAPDVNTEPHKESTDKPEESEMELHKETTGIHDITTTIPETSPTESQKQATEDTATKISDIPPTELDKDDVKPEIVTSVPNISATEPQDEVTAGPQAHDVATSVPETESKTDITASVVQDLTTSIPTTFSPGPTTLPETDVTKPQKEGTETPTHGDTSTYVPDVHATESQKEVTDGPEAQDVVTNVPETPTESHKQTQSPETEAAATSAPELPETEPKKETTEFPAQEAGSTVADISETEPKKEVTKMPEIQVVTDNATTTEVTNVPEAQDAATNAPEVQTESHKEVTEELQTEPHNVPTETPESQNTVVDLSEVLPTESQKEVTEIPDITMTMASNAPETLATKSDKDVTETPQQVTEEVTKIPGLEQTEVTEINAETEKPAATEKDEALTETPLRITTKFDDHAQSEPHEFVTSTESSKTESDTSLSTESGSPIEQFTQVTELLMTESPDKTTGSDSDLQKPSTGVAVDDKKPEEGQEIDTEAPIREPTKTESPISPELIEPETKAPELMENGTTIAPESYVTENQDHTYAPENEPHGSRRTEATSAPVEEEDIVTKVPQTLEPQDKTTKISEEPEQTSESKEKYPETTPYLVLLEEHTHKTVSPDEDINASPSDVPLKDYETSTSEVIIDRVTESASSSEPDKSPEDVISDKDHSTPELTLTTISEKITESSLVPEEVTTISPLPESISTEKPQYVESNEISTSAPMIDQELIETEKPSVSSVEPDTEKVLTSQKPPETTAPEEEFIYATTKATPIKEESTTLSPLLDKFGKPDDKPKPAVESEKPKPDTTEELPKPGANEVQPTEEAIQPEEESHFPPSGTSGYGQEPDYGEEDSFGPGTCRYGGKVYVSAQQIPRDDPCDFCFCFRSDIICLQQSCPPPIHGCHEEPIQGFCCPRYECPVSMATTLNVTTTTTTTTTTLPPHFLPHAYKGAAQRRGCQIKGHTYKVGEVVRASSGPCLHCTCGGDGQMKCDPKVCTPEPMLRQMIAAAVSAKRRR